MISLAAVAEGNGHFEITETEILEPTGDDVLVKIMAAGLCHTDYDSMKWGKPLVMGHEGSGVIAAVGEKVQDFRIGDSVILNWATPCGECFQCQQGNQNICERNFRVAAGGNGYSSGHAVLHKTRFRNQPVIRSFNLGTLSEYALVREAALVKTHSRKIFTWPRILFRREK